MRQEISRKIRLVLHEDFNVELPIEDSTRLDNLELDSLDVVCLSQALEDDFDIIVSKPELQSWVTLNDVINCIEAKQRGKR